MTDLGAVPGGGEGAPPYFVPVADLGEVSGGEGAPPYFG